LEQELYKLDFKTWLHENGTSAAYTTAASVEAVPNRLFGPSSIPGGFQQPIKNYRNCGLAGCLKKQVHTREKFFN
jgi:hypothetical protein